MKQEFLSWPTPPSEPERPEPVAYLYSHDETGRTTLRMPEDRLQERRWSEHPLFMRAPKPALDLSDEQIDNVAKAHPECISFLVHAGAGGVTVHEFRAALRGFARAVLAAAQEPT
jgi:hypothetical protein